MIPKEYRGKVFIQHAPRLRWRGTKSPEVESFRPVDDLTGEIVGDPPVISFEEDAEVDIERWISLNRIQLSTDPDAKPGKPLSDAEAHARQPRAATEPAAEAQGGS